MEKVSRAQCTEQSALSSALALRFHRLLPTRWPDSSFAQTAGPKTRRFSSEEAFNCTSSLYRPTSCRPFVSGSIADIAETGPLVGFVPEAGIAATRRW
jgi:hypothetical protein